MNWQCILTILLLATPLAQAQPYRWVDDKGRVQFSDTPPAKAKAVKKKPVAETPAPAAAPAEQPIPFEVQQARKDFPATLYTAPICKQPCELAREALNKRGVPFTEVQVWNAETLEQLKSKASTDNVPALVVGRTALTGFDQARYDGLLDSAGYPKQGAVPARAQRAPDLPAGYEPPPQAQPVAPETTATSSKPGPYDTSGLPSNQSAKPAPYDTSKLPAGRSEKPGPYVTPGSTK